MCAAGYSIQVDVSLNSRLPVDTDTTTHLVAEPCPLANVCVSCNSGDERRLGA